MKVEFCVIPNSPLSLLLGCDFYKTYTPDILLKSRLLRLRDRQAPLITSSNGHWSVNLDPLGYRALVASRQDQSLPETGDIPRKLRDRKPAPRGASRLLWVLMCALACSTATTAGVAATTTSLPGTKSTYYLRADTFSYST